MENSLTNFSNYTPKTNKTSNNTKSLKSSPSSSSNHCQSNNNILDSLHIYYQNVRGIRTKSKNFYLQTLATNGDVITLTETWLNNSHKSEEYFGNDFIVYRRDRSHLNSSASIGGGVLLAISSKIHSEQLNLDGFDHLEFICTKLTFKKTKFIIYCLYIPPNATIDTFHDHIEAIKKIKYNINETLIIIGDFNLPSITWIENDEDNDYLPTNIRSEAAIFTCESMLQEGLRQINNIHNIAGNTLDLVFTSDTSSTTVLKAPKPISKIDVYHQPFEILIECPQQPTEPNNDSITTYCFKNTNFDALNTFLNGINFADILNNLSTDCATDKFLEILFTGFDMFIPKRTFIPSKHPPWYTKQLKNLKNQKDKAHKKWKKTGDASQYITIRNQFDILNQSLYDTHMVKIQEDLIHNPKHFWHYVKMKKNNSNYPKNMHYNGKTSTNDSESVELFADFFKNVYIDNQNDNIDVDDIIDNCPELDITPFNADQIYDELTKINANKSKGPDNVHPIILKNCAVGLATPLQIIFNKSIQEGKYPSKWKTSYITPLHKKGSKNSVENYRGIAILPTFGKFFELLVHKFYVRPKIDDIISNKQHGFCKSRSTSTSLIGYTHFVKNAMANGDQVDTFEGDLRKAFDQVIHSILLSTVAENGFGKKLTNWIRSFLSDRFQYVKLDDKCSSTFCVSSGVPQGSHLSPDLFLLLINDCPEIFNDVIIDLYADDARIYTIVNNPDDARRLQNAINKFVNYCKNKLIEVNIEKSVILSLHRKHTPFVANYHINNQQLKRVNEFTDLGVLFDQKCDFVKHIELKVTKAYAMFGFLRRICSNMYNPMTLKSLYYAFVRSHLEYASTVWNPHYEIHNNSIESIQRKFSAYALTHLGWHDYNQPMPSYSQRCELLNLETLCRRRINSSIFFIYDVLTGKYTLPSINLPINEPARTLRRNNLFNTQTHRTNYAINEPINRMCTFFNIIQDNFNESTSRTSFRKSIKQLDDTNFHQLHQYDR